MYRRIHVLLLDVVLILTLSGSSACTVGAETTEEFHKTLSPAAGTPLTVENTNGSITITTWNRKDVDILAVKKTRKGRDELDKVEIIISENGKLSIETEYLERNAKVSVNYTIKVPATIPVALVRTTNGSLELEGTTGDTVARTTNGSITVRDADGAIESTTTNGNISIRDASSIKRAKTTNGKIEVSFDRLTSDTEFTTTNGSVDVRFPAGMNADLELQTTNGSIRANGIKMMVNEISKRHLSGKLGSGGTKINVKTTNGSISLEEL